MIITYTRERRCKDCNNLRYFHPNPEKYYRRHKCIITGIQQNRDSTTAVRCDNFDWNPTEISKHINQ